MDKELLIDGFIYHGPGCCPKCCGPLVVADSELTLMELNTDGKVISEETTVRCEAACLHCGERVKMIRWEGGYIPYSKTSLLLKQLQLKDLAKDRLEGLNDSSKGENPFKL